MTRKYSGGRFICIHGHFYQPPRENPWTGKIERQIGARPYLNWNERITAECYAPNASARILDGNGDIEQLVNNYAKISFNFGPTLLRWLNENAPLTYRAILEADQQSLVRFGGHGSAIAQAYHHSILPLANRRDKSTEIAWGIRDFEHRFGRKPEGMWLAETGADAETLDVLSEHGILYTILSPSQAARVRGKDEAKWEDVIDGRIDTRRPYEVELQSGRKMSVFFYDGKRARAVAFEKLLNNGEVFAHRLIEGFDSNSRDQLVNIATDGESYGHHHRFGEMALAYALRAIETAEGVDLTVYGEHLDRVLASHRVQIVEGSSWSCSHGIERWRSDCGCQTGGEAGWSQAWRTPLRDSLDWLRDSLANRFEIKVSDYIKDPWAARDHYVDLLLDDSKDRKDRFLRDWSTRGLSESEKKVVLNLFEMQRFALMMYTSCGWFFNDISGIETIQILRYAARAIEIAEEMFAESLESEFLRRLSKARSNIVEEGNGRNIFERTLVRSRS